MASVPWVPGLTLPQGENDVLDYTFDFARWLDGDAISSATVDGEGLTATVQETTAASVRVRVSAAAPNSVLRLSVDLASGMRSSFTTFFNPVRSTCGKC